MLKGAENLLIFEPNQNLDFDLCKTLDKNIKTSV